ncbi:TPA: helicase-related protein [Legionella pneumophila]|nr:DEAD/DEAH box helicase family protein [Legionella pneumophila]HAT5916682.1 DEAD/DEAH box helicase family protein [Legionella pneumophila]HAU0665172.1 DEAD/DEAH box helicase [Legionella pneumophila]HAU1721232.1 DEAD/DEAH box helicase [Legionella pneumophila]HCC0380148.1 DEAD/DEAH box helicase family protein [Legionella pneumophila]
MQLIDNTYNLWGDELKKSLHPGSKLKIAASYFSIYAFEALKKELSQIESLQFIFTKPAFVPNDVTDKLRKEHREFYIPKKMREKNLYGTEFEIQLKNKLNQRAIAKECAAWIREKVKFRSNSTKSPMQQFACVDSNPEQCLYTMINGFTAVDLGYQKGDAISNFISKDNTSQNTSAFLQMFDQIWNDTSKVQDVTETVCYHIESVYQENSPEKMYFFILYNIFNEFLEDLNEDILPNDLTGYQNTVVWNKLFNFQKDAATGIINKLEKFNGCILADSVGLGKTFTALAVIKYYELRNRSVLVLCPKKLANNWLNYNKNLKTNLLAKDRLNYDVLCHTDLQRTSGESFGIQLDRINWGNYDLVVIDESHNFRNNEAYKDKETRYQKLMNAVIKDGVKTKVLMLSATPVNNRFNDLRNQLALAYEGESETLRDKLKTGKSIEEIFKQAQAAFNAWSKLPIEQRTAKAILDVLDFDFFELLDSVTIARSRKHIETFYDTSEIGSFPTRLKPISYRSPLTNRKDTPDFNEIYQELLRLKLSVYAPVSYILPSRIKKYEDLYDTTVEGGKGKLRQVDRERSLQSLMTTNLLKRLESSVEAFRLTLKSLKNNHTYILNKIELFNSNGEVSSIHDLADSLDKLEAEDEDFSDLGDFRTGGKVQINFADMDLPSWEFDLKADLKVISELLNVMEKIIPKDDEKLQSLIQHIANKIANPINPGNKKILIFTAFADTADYLYGYLSPILKDQGIHCAKVTGSNGAITTLKKGYDFQTILTLFSPLSLQKEQVVPDEPEEIDVLIGTDCISEGQNLQDCDYLINYDIHWNPVRIIQRFGRVDRIGSKNKVIQLVNYWPDISLDEYINLKERVENRMVIVDVTATGDDNVLSAQANDVSYRKEQLQRLQDEVIEMEDLKTGVNITDLGLNDFRMDLVNYVKHHGDLDDLPGGMHAVLPACPDKGLYPGVVFTLRNRQQGININQHNRLHPYYLVYISENGGVITDHTAVKQILDLLRANCKGYDEPILDICVNFNKKTNDGRNMSFYSDLLSKTIQSIIQVKEEKDIDSLFTQRKTTALVDSIKGLDDFELLSFIVIEGENRG